jgi:DNA-binding beta-propeller fold protein YncE
MTAHPSSAHPGDGSRVPAGRTFLIAAAAFVLAAAAAPAANGPRVVSIATTGFPNHVVAGYRSIWVAGHRGGFLYRINPRSNRVIAAIDIGDAMCTPLTVGAAKLWAANCPGLGGAASTYAIDPRTNRVVGRRAGIAPVFAAGSLWLRASASRLLLRTDPRSGLVLARIQPGFDTSGDWKPMGFGYGTLWVGSDSAVSRVDPDTNHVTAVIPLPAAKANGGYSGGYAYGATAAFAGGKAWVTNAAGIYVIDPQTNTAHLLPIRITPFTNVGDIVIVAAEGKLWVRTSDRQVVALDPGTGGVVRRYVAAGGGGGLTVAFDALWVANAGKDTVWREPLR